ncbi:MAG: right-handed parallel beta-helix repeat-containing protein [Mucilaginibacter sp.]|uniref:right-handed parallel beta-helix repeat-containing protein n=1 Tax=Mucilaginibacter sp. TaxID=1882438 RepID=UPI0034E42230
MALPTNHQPIELQYQKSDRKDDQRFVQWPYSENFDQLAGSEVINLNGAHNLQIKGKTISGAKETCITLTNCANIRISNCRFVNGKIRGIYLYNCRNITIENNFFDHVVTGVLADHCQGGIVVEHNQFLNMLGPMPGGQYVQFNTVEGAGCSISYNKGENILGEGKPEDCINLYKSRGTAESPIKVIGNWIRGGGPSSSGGGIILGDNGGSYQIAKDNILVNPGEYGMAIAGGNHISIINNRIYGKSQPFTNVGLYVNAIGGYKISHAVVKGNRINFYNAANYNNNWWLADQSQKPEGWENGGNILGDKTLNENMLPQRLVSGK